MEERTCDNCWKKKKGVCNEQIENCPMWEEDKSDDDS